MLGQIVSFHLKINDYCNKTTSNVNIKNEMLTIGQTLSKNSD